MAIILLCLLPAHRNPDESKKHETVPQVQVKDTDQCTNGQSQPHPLTTPPAACNLLLAVSVEPGPENTLSLEARNCPPPLLQGDPPMSPLTEQELASHSGKHSVVWCSKPYMIPGFGSLFSAFLLVIPEMSPYLSGPSSNQHVCHLLP